MSPRRSFVWLRGLFGFVGLVCFDLGRDFFRGGEGLGDVVDVGGGAVYADEGGVAYAAVVVDVGGGDEGVALQDEVDRFGGSLRLFDSCFQGIAGEYIAVDCDDLLAGE